eukprot:gene10879-12675_t
MTLPHLVEDLGDFISGGGLLRRRHTENAAVVLVGHSMGGKVNMLYTLKHPHDIDGIVNVDVAPTCYVGVHNHDSKFEAMRRAATLFGSPTTTRATIDETLASHGLDRGERMYLMNNLVDQPGTPFKWRINLPTLHNSQNEMLTFPSSSDLATLCNDGRPTIPYERPSLFVGGADSHYLKPPFSNSINQYFPQHQLHLIPGGHFAHVQHPRSFVHHLHEYLLAVDQRRATSIAPPAPLNQF